MRGGNAPEYELTDTSAKNVCTDSHRVLLHRHDTSIKNVPEGDKFFFFLRDPVSRFISGFYSRKRKGLPRYYSAWSKGEHMAFQRFETPNQLARSLSANSEEEKKAACCAMKAIRHVGDHYSEWYESKDYFLSRISDALMVGRVEELNRQFQNLKDILNIPPKTELPVSQREAHKNQYSELDTSLDKEAKENLEKWYKKDYDFMDLCERYAHQLNYLG
jgi:hypothetical protein